MSTICDLRAGRRDNLVFDDAGRLRLAPGTSEGSLTSAVLKTGAVRVNWLAQWTAPLRWRKHPDNPIYGPLKSGAWDSWTNGVSIVPCENDTRYRMYYAGAQGEGIGFAEASVDDPLTWTEHPASPVLRPRADNWEGNQINQPRVVKVTETHWRMYYTGWGFQGPGTAWALGMAESFDGGTTWKRYQDDPIFERGAPDSPDGAGACVPSLLRIDGRVGIKIAGQWWMWYTAGQLNLAGHQNIHLCLAFSDDGIHWEKHPGNPVLTDDFRDGAPRSVTSRCFVRLDDGVFRLWYSFAKPDYRICYAESLDGIHWERAPISPVLDVSPAPAWDDVMVEYPEVQIVDGAYRLWFCGNGYGSVGYAEGTPDTAVLLYARTGDAAEPDAGWTDWTRIARDAEVSGRYLQLRAVLTSTDPAQSPTLNRIEVT